MLTVKNIGPFISCRLCFVTENKSSFVMGDRRIFDSTKTLSTHRKLDQVGSRNGGFRVIV